MRIMGLDYGSKTVGVAISDELMITAQPVMTIERKSENKLRKTLAKIEELIKEYEVSFVVLGYPKNMDNSEGQRVAATKEFMEHIERRTGLEVYLQDERMTTVESERILKEAGVRREHRKEFVDKMAAAVILQSYLDSRVIERE